MDTLERSRFLVPRRARSDGALVAASRPMIWAPPADPKTRRLHPDSRMAISASGLYVLTFKDMWDNTDFVFDFLNDTVKLALFTNTITPNFSSDTAYGVSPYNANEVSGTGYTAGGATLALKTVSESPTGTLMIDAADPSWTTATFSSARGGLMWDDTATSPADAAICLINFGADYGVTAGTFTVQLASGGIWTIDLTP